MKKEFVKPEIKSLRLRENILAGSGGSAAGGGTGCLKHQDSGCTQHCYYNCPTECYSLTGGKCTGHCQTIGF
ncbi:MAG: hypothetical protein IKQ72_11180 [Bacteroidaceae bacterium]|nr:hypothetical protein [Bacteroidaceae bacterium]